MCLNRSTDFNPRVSGLFLSETYIGLSGEGDCPKKMRIDRWVCLKRYKCVRDWEKRASIKWLSRRSFMNFLCSCFLPVELEGFVLY